MSIHTSKFSYVLAVYICFFRVHQRINPVPYPLTCTDMHAYNMYSVASRNIHIYMQH